MKTLLIDNYDSFTFNLYQLIAEVNGEEPIVLANDAPWEMVEATGAESIVISPGPGRPEVERDFGICRRAILESPLPLLGVCLGHEGIGHLFGGRVVHAPEVMHGRLSSVMHNGSELFDAIPRTFRVVRYHSLAVAEPLPDELEAIAWSDGVLMALRHRTRPLWGVQFHPESIGTEHGRQLIENFRAIADRFHGTTRSRATTHFTTASPRRSRRATSDGSFAIRSMKLARMVDAGRAFATLMAREPHAFWLDSSRVEEGLSRFSFIGAASGPHAAVLSYRTDDRALTITERGATRTIRTGIFEYLECELARRHCRSDDLPFDFNCGYVGYLGYELKGECGGARAHHASTPDAGLIFADRIIAFDHLLGEIYLVALHPSGNATEAERWMEESARKLEELGDDPAGEPAGSGSQGIEFTLARDRERYMLDIAECLREIDEGESYEICLTNQITASLDLDPLELYRTLRRMNPAPYAAYLRLGDLAVLSASPERFLRIDREGWVESKPIKGTRPRGRDAAEDDAIRRELAGSVKDRAENLMIVDLIRNDLGRVCDVGSVTVTKLMDVESYATVHQLVSTIRGHVRDDRGAIDCIRSAFPGGSMTGAPKLRTMEIIDRLEGAPRGIYSGAIGFLALNGSADLNIVIRTIVMTPKRATIGVGGAIVALSDPDEEFDEMMLKGEAQMEAALRFSIE